MKTEILNPTPAAVARIEAMAKAHKAEQKKAKKRSVLKITDPLERANQMARAWTERRILNAWLKLEKVQWAAVSNDDQDEAGDYRRALLSILRRFCGRYEKANGFKREFAFWLANLQDRRAQGSIAKHINAVSANDFYLEELEIAQECASYVKR